VVKGTSGQGSNSQYSNPLSKKDHDAARQIPIPPLPFTPVQLKAAAKALGNPSPEPAYVMRRLQGDHAFVLNWNNYCQALAQVEPSTPALATKDQRKRTGRRGGKGKGTASGILP